MYTGKKAFLLTGEEFSLIIVGIPWHCKGRNSLTQRWEGILSRTGAGCPGWRWSSHLWRDLEQVYMALGDMGYCCLGIAGILKVFSNLNNSRRILWVLLPPQSNMSSALRPSPAQCIMQMSLPAPKTFQSHLPGLERSNSRSGWYFQGAPGLFPRADSPWVSGEMCTGDCSYSQQ